MTSNSTGRITKEDIKNIIDNEPIGADYEVLKSKIQDHLTSFFKNENFINNEADIKERLYKMIEYASVRYEYYSDQRHKFMNLGLSFIGVSATLIGILLSNTNSVGEDVKLCGYICSTILFATGVVMLFIYNDYTTANYPYRKIMDIQSWYFKYKFSDKLDYKLSNKKSQADKQLVEVTNSYLVSVYNWIDKSKIKNYFIKEDIEQVAILQLLQKYGRDCVSKMKRIMNWGIVLFIAVPVVKFGVIPILILLGDFVVYLFP